MGIYIKIIKYKQDNSTLYYSVLTDTNIPLYYIVLDAERKIISFYINNDFNKELAIFDVNKKQFTYYDPKFESLINMRVISRATESIEKNYFPDDISWCS